MTNHKNLDSVTYLHFRNLDSTQTFSEKKAQVLRLKEGSWLVVTARRQTAGRGTHNRPWVSPYGNLYATFSTLIPHTVPTTYIPQVIAYAIVQMLKDYAIEHAAIKWVNDVLVQDKKIAGILCSTAPYTQGLKTVHIGVGLNVNMEQKDCDAIQQPTTSMSLVLNGGPLKLKTVFHALEKTIYYHMHQFIEVGFPCFLEKINQNLAFLGEEVVFDRGAQGLIEGTFLGLTKEGYLRLRTQEGLEQVFYSGRILKTFFNT